ncbi:MAG: IS4 family transposase [Acidimicrobiales bacterium]
MPRSGWVKPASDRRLSDLVSIGLLTRVFPPGVIDEAIDEAGRREIRNRVLPARVMVYFAIGMAMYSEGAYEDIFSQLSDGLSWSKGWSESLKPPSKSALFQARLRLGSEPLRKLFAKVVSPLATSDTPGSWFATRRVMAIDGTCLDIADTVANETHFGRPPSSRGDRSAFPQARIVALAECGTHAIIDAVVGPCTTSEVELTRELISRLHPGMLVLADRGLYGFDLWGKAADTGADLLFRVKSTLSPHHEQTLEDGSWIASIKPTSGTGRHQREPHRVRVIDYTVNGDERYRLITTLLNPSVAPAEGLARLYAERWEIETTFDELKTHQRGSREVLRSKSPELIYQEIWGHLCCHYAIRVLMANTAEHSGHDPDRISLVADLRIVRHSVAKDDFPPGGNS